MREFTKLTAARCAITAAALALVAGAASADQRTIDGTNNNLANTNQGSANTQLLRQTTIGYDNLAWTMARSSVTGPREISNAIFAQSSSILNNRAMTDMVWQWGQFIDHDIDLTPENGVVEPAPISTPLADPYFAGTPIGFNRSVFDPATGANPANPRQQMNQITSYLDASNVYGSDTTRANFLRSGVNGKLNTSAGNLLPFNDGTQDNAGGPGTNLFVGGDVRANEQVGLTAMHTLFMREHNRRADQIEAANPGTFSDQEIYDQARNIVAAEIQAVTYNEFIPSLMGNAAVPSYAGYDSNTDASVSNVFSAAAYRLGHTMLSGELQRLDSSGNVIPEGNLPLRDAFFDPTRITTEGGIEPLIRGLATQAAQEIDAKVVDDVRNFLFGNPGAGGFDLVSLNIQRGRDHGLADYNTIRQDFGLAPVNNFTDITSDPALQTALASVYANVNEIDPWVGMLAEDHEAGSSLGETLMAVIGDQFARLRDGDRFFYLNTDDDNGLAGTLASIGMSINDLDGTLLSDIIKANTDITNIQRDVFRVPTPGPIALLAFAALTTTKRRRNKA